MTKINFIIRIETNEAIETVLGEVLNNLYDLRDNQLLINKFSLDYAIKNR